tara:strand:+ start:4226 stop:4726 length:501 start_codon:yes stop_codon:yes gene_type:complete
MSAYKVIDQALKTAGEFYIDLLQTELAFQQHIASKKLYSSFKTIVSERGGNLYMDVVNDTEYMWMVNDGNTSAPNVEFKDIQYWAKLKGLDFSKKRIWSVTEELRQNYYTAGGLLIAPRRTKFIDYAFGIADSMGINQMIEQDILKQIDAVIGEEGQSKAIQLTIS